MTRPDVAVYRAEAPVAISGQPAQHPAWPAQPVRAQAAAGDPAAELAASYVTGR